MPKLFNHCALSWHLSLCRAKKCIQLAMLISFSPLAYGFDYIKGNIGYYGASDKHTPFKHSQQHALVGELNLGIVLDDHSRFLLSVNGARSVNGAQNALDIRELSYTARLNKLSIQLGIGQVFWGVTESRHLVNVINQQDLRFNRSGTSYLGQPMLSLTYRDIYENKWSLYLMPCYRASTTSMSPQHYSNTVVDTYCDRIDYAIRSDVSLGYIDLGIAYFNGHSREPDRLNSVDHYAIMRRFSLDGQLTHNSWLWKLEAITESFGRIKKDHYAAVAGVEYIFAEFASSYDIGLLYETLIDSTHHFLTSGNMIGLRIGTNDASDTQVLLTFFRQRRTHEKNYQLRFEKRLYNSFKLHVDALKNNRHRHVSLSVKFNF